MWSRAAMKTVLRQWGWDDLAFSAMDDGDMMAELVNALKPVAAFDVQADGNMTVWTEWTGVPLDRPRTSGVSVGRNHKLGERLARAINAGVVHRNVCLMVDVDGKTYVQSTSVVLGRYLNADLKGLGF